MTKISSNSAYPNKPSPILNDKVVGTDSETINQNTVNFLFSDIKYLILAGLSPEIGGTLKVTEIVYSGVLTTPEAVANQLDPAQIIQRYEVLILSVNGNKYQLKLQDVTLGVLQVPILSTDFIPISLVAKNLSNAISFYKGLNVLTGREEHYSIGSVGFSITKEIVSGSETGKILLEQTEQTNLGTGVSVYKGFNSSTKKQEFRRIASDTQIIELAGDTIKINTPATASIPALYINDLYVPTYNDWLIENQFQNSGTAVNGFIFRGKGTMAQPFTNNTVYPLLGGSVTITPDTAIQNALDGDSAYTLPYSYVGSTALLYSRLNPQRSGQQIIVQDNNGSYTFSENFNYTNLDLKLEGSVLSTTTGFLVDMEDSLGFNQTTSKITISIDENRTLQLQGQGLKNNGSTIATGNLSLAKTITLLGNGYIFTTTNDITKYIINSDTTSTGNNNDGNLTFDVKCNLRAVYQGIYFVGGNSKVDFYKIVQSGDLGVAVNVNLKAFNQTGGLVRFFNQSEIRYEGVSRTNVFTFEPSTYSTSFLGLGNYFSGASATNMFNKLNSNNVAFSVNNTQSTHNITNIFESPNIWLANFRDNSFNKGNIDITKVDLTQGNNISAINTIGNNILENLVIYDSKASAKAAGLSTNSAFIKRNIINAVDLIAGVEYKVVTSGSPSLGTVGSFFTATGSETGTGTASLEIREILT